MYAEPLVDVVYYGQDEDDEWHRFDKLFSPYITKETILQYRDVYIDKYSMEHLTWGVDSTLYVQNIMTGGYEDVGYCLFFDLDVRGNYEDAIYNFVDIIRSNSDVDVYPDMYETESGIHIYFFDVLEWDDIEGIMKMDYVHDIVDDKFWKSTLKTGSSVLRLSKYKRGERNSIVPYDMSDDYKNECSFLNSFVYNMMVSDIDG